MKIAIVDKSDLSVASWYEADQPNQSNYGGPWGNPSLTVHIGIGTMDQRAVTFELDGSNIVAVEDADKKAEAEAADAKAAVQKAVAGAIAFGQGLITEFAAENVMLGITQDGKTGEVLDKMQHVMVAVQSGSLYEAIARAKAITPDQYDDKYVTHDRIYAFINKLEAYLGLQLSQ